MQRAPPTASAKRHVTAELCAEFRLTAVPDLYGGLAQKAASGDAIFSDFLEETLRGEREVRRSWAREMFARTA